jgi:hypothetical protein
LTGFKINKPIFSIKISSGVGLSLTKTLITLRRPAKNRQFAMFSEIVLVHTVDARFLLSALLQRTQSCGEDELEFDEKWIKEKMV